MTATGESLDIGPTGRLIQTYRTKGVKKEMTNCDKCDTMMPHNRMCDACEESSTIILCPRCDRPMKESGGCAHCGMTRPDPAREAEIDRRIHAMKRIHELEMSMTGLQRREWIEHGQYILNRDRGESVGFGLGEK